MSIILALALTIGPAPVTASRVTEPLPEKSLATSGLVLNEVCYDTRGIDGGREWFEIYNTTGGEIDLTGLQVRNESDRVVYRFPSSKLSRASYAVVYLGPKDLNREDTDSSDGSAVFYSGGKAIALLPNASGGLFLESAGVIEDCVFWGDNAAASGSGFNRCVAAGQWVSGAFVDTSFANGTPLQEGDSIGRNSASTDTNASKDWDVAGGENAVRITEAEQNDMFLYSEGALVHMTQGILNDLILQLGVGSGNDTAVTNATHTINFVSDVDLIDGFSVDANHVIDVDFQGIPLTLSGSIVTNYERVGTAGNTSYSVSMKGTLTGPGGTALSLDHSLSRSGFHTTSRLEVTRTSSILTNGGVDYPYVSNISNQVKQSGSNTWDITDTRASTDWGGAGSKTSGITIARTRTGDGAYAESVTGSRSFPAPPPPLGSTQSVIGTETFAIEKSFSLDADMQVDQKFSKFDLTVKDTQGNTLTSQSLAEDSSFSVKRTQGTPYTRLGEWTIVWDWKSQFANGGPQLHKVLTTSLNREYDSNGIFIEHGTIVGTIDGNPGIATSYYVDGVALAQQCGCGCGLASCKCGAPAKKKGDDDPWHIKQGLIIGACGVGGVITAPSVGGTAIVLGYCGWLLTFF